MSKKRKRAKGELKIKIKYWIRKTKKVLKRLARFLFNPHMLICFGLAWMITNGWCYVFIAVGGWLGIGWMLGVGTAYAAFLWIPFTPEKIITVAISLFLLKLLFPDDEKTLKVLREEFQRLKAAIIRKKSEHKAKRQAKTEQKQLNSEADKQENEDK